MQVGKGEFFEQAARIGKGVFIFSGKAHQDIGSDGGPGHLGLDGQNLPAEQATVVGAVHSLQDRVVTALQGEMKVGAKKILCGYERDEFFGNLVGFNGTQTDSHCGAFFRDTLQLQNLDLNELDATINALALALATYADELIEFAKSG